MDQTAEYSAQQLADSLRDRGIRCSVGVADEELVVYCERRQDMKLVPAMYNARRVRIEHSGKIRPC